MGGSPVRFRSWSITSSTLSRVERLEVEAAAGVVIGRDRLGVVVDDHRVIADLANRPGSAHRAVVELDALADADGAGAHHDDAAPLRRRRDLRQRVRAVEVRRLGGKLAGAGVDAPVCRRRSPPGPGPGGWRPRERRTAPRSPHPRSRPVSPPAAAGRRGPLHLDELREPLGEPRRDPGEARQRRGIGVAMAQQGHQAPEAGVGAARKSSRSDPAARRSRPQAGSSQSHPRPRGSRDRTALSMAGPNSRSMAIASPVAFIWTPSERSAVGNLSKGQRGSLTTT